MSHMITHLKRVTMNYSPIFLFPEPLHLKRGSKNFIAYNRLDTKNKNLPEVLFLCGLKSDMMGTKATYLHDLCQNRGQTFTRFDYFGHGLSSGEFTQGTIGLWLADTLAMI